MEEEVLGEVLGWVQKVLIVEKSPLEEEPEVPTNPEIPAKQITLEKRYYHGVCVILHFKK